MTNPSLNCLSQGHGATTMTTHPILPSRNEDYGFFRALTVCSHRDRRSVDVWTLASRLIAVAIGADSEDEMIGIRDFLDSRMGRHFATDRRVCRNGTTAQVVAIGKAAGHTHNIDALGQARVLVPDHRHFGTDRLECHRQIAVTVRAGKNDDRCVHQLISTV